MDGFELIVSHGHANEWIKIVLAMHELLPIAQEFAKGLLAARRRIDDFAAERFANCDAWNLARRHFDCLDSGADSLRYADAKWAMFERAKALHKSLAIPQCFASCGVCMLAHFHVSE